MNLTRIALKRRKRHHSLFAPDLIPTTLRAAFRAALQRENLTGAWAGEIFGLRTLTAFFLLLLSAAFLEGQNKGAEKTKLPVQAAIVRDKTLPSEFKIGNVIVTYSDGTTDLWTLKGNCADPKVSTKGRVGWEVYKLNSDGKTLASYNGLYINDHLNICDHGRVVASLAPAKGFIEGWDFTKDGEHVVIKSRGAHGPATIELFSLRDGTPVKSVQAFEKSLPDWAVPFADSD